MRKRELARDKQSARSKHSEFKKNVTQTQLETASKSAVSESADSTPTLEHAERLKGKVRMPSAIWVWSMHTLSIQKLGETRWPSAIVDNSVYQMSKTVVSIPAADPDRM